MIFVLVIYPICLIQVETPSVYIAVQTYALLAWPTIGCHDPRHILSNPFHPSRLWFFSIFREVFEKESPV